MEPQRFRDGRSPDVESITEQIRADKSKGSRTLTGWIETPQILSALLNFRKINVGGEKKIPAAKTSSGQQAVLGPRQGGGFLKEK